MVYAKSLKKEAFILSTFFCFVCFCELVHVSLGIPPPMPLRIAYIGIFLTYCLFNLHYIPIFIAINLVVERFSTIPGEFLPNTIWFHSAILFICWAFIRYHRPTFTRQYNKTTLLLFLFFFLYVFCSYIIYSSVINNISLVANIIFSLLFFIVLLHTDDLLLKRLLIAIFASITFVSIIGLFNYDNIVSSTNIGEETVERALGWKDANYLSCFIGICMLFTIFLARCHKKKLLFYLSLLIQSICLLVLISRGAILSFCIAILFYFRKQLFSTKIVGYVILTTLILLFFYESGLLEGLILRFNSEDATSGRDQIWEVGLTTFLSKDPTTILFGAGEGQAINMAYFSFAHWSPHNNYLEILFNYGFVGLSLFLLFLLSLFFNGKSEEKRTILLFILINSMSIVPFTFVMPIWIVMALLLIWDKRISKILQA